MRFIDLEPGKLGGDLCVAVVAALCPAILDREVATVDPTEFAQPLNKSSDPLTLDQRRGWPQEPDGRQLPRPLRAGRKRPRSRAAERG
jgi:hypothetical protein